MRQQHDIVEVQQARGNAGLVLVDIQTGASDLAGNQGIRQRFFVDQIAARGVDDKGMGLQFGQALAVQDIVGLLGCRSVQGDNVHVLQHVVQVRPIGGLQLVLDGLGHR